MMLVFIVSPLTVEAQDKTLQAPNSIEEVREGIEGVGENIFKGVLRAIAGIWEEKVIPVWKSMWQWTVEDAWQKRVEPALQNIIDRVKEFLGQEVEKRKPIAEQQLEEEKQEIKQELQDQGTRATKGLWERFKALFR